MAVAGIQYKGIHSFAVGGRQAFYDATEARYARFAAPAAYSASQDYFWPVNPPSVTGQMLTSDTGGQMSWTNPPTGGGGGSGISVPVGAIIDWHRDLPVNTAGGAVPPTLPPEFNTCDGQLCSDPTSIYYNQRLPNLNGFPADGTHLAGARTFLRGNYTTTGAVASSGGAGSETHSHSLCIGSFCEGRESPPKPNVSVTPTGPTSTLPPYMDVIKIIRIK